MDIVISVESFDPEKGYLEYYLAKELARLNHNVTIFSFKRGRKLSESMLDNFHVVYIPSLTNIHSYSFFGLRERSVLIKIIKEASPEVIHCQPLFSPLSLFLMNCQKSVDYKIVGSLISQEPSLNSLINEIEYSFVKNLVKRYIKKRTELFFAKTDALRKMLVLSFGIPFQKTCVIPLGADPELFRFSVIARKRVRTQLGLSDEDVVVIYSGKIIPSKDLEVLIAALAPIIKQDRKVKLLIVGEGKACYTTHLKELLSNLKVSNNIIFHHWVHRTKLPGFYSASDIGVWPGVSSISIVEAASIGLPIIMAKSPIEIYAIENENGFAFERGNVNELREYLRILIYNEEIRKEMGRRSRLLVERKLNWRSIAIQHLDAYKHALQL